MLPLFRDLNVEQLNKLLPHIRRKTFVSDDFILRAGERSRYRMYRHGHIPSQTHYVAADASEEFSPTPAASRRA